MSEPEAEPAWRITNANRAAADGPWLAAISITVGRWDATTLHVARVDTTGKVWLPASLPAEYRAAAAPAVAAAALALLGEGRG